MRDFATSPLPRWAERLSAEVGLAVALGFILALLGPFRTYESEALQRAGFWMGLSALWFVMLMIVDRLLDRAAMARQLNMGERIVANVVLAAVPMLFFVVPATQALFSFATGWEKIIHLYPVTLFIGAGLTLASTAILGRSQPPSPATPPADAESVPPARSLTTQPSLFCPLLERLPPHLRGPILCLQTEDHYVRIFTGSGSSLVLMRMSDAIVAMGDASGLRVHRSWWVATDAVRSCNRLGRRLSIELSNGLIVPVSQPYAAAVRDISVTA